MGKDPAFLFYYQDFLVGTSFMTLEETGAYVKLLCFQAAKGILKEKDILKKIPAPIWEAICCNFCKEEGGFYNKRLREEIEKRRLFTESRRKNLHMGKHMKKHMDIKSTSHMENENENKNEDVIKDIIEDLNEVLSTSYKHTSLKTKELINARLAEGFKIDDFKVVHRNMFKRWGVDNKMREFLRPITLYSNKFESYLNVKQELPISTEGAKAIMAGKSWLGKKEVIDVKQE